MIALDFDNQYCIDKRLPSLREKKRKLSGCFRIFMAVDYAL